MRRGCILGMKIVNNHEILPADFVHRDQVVNGLLESAERLIVVQIADVLADERLPVHDQRDCVLQIGADRQQRAPDGKLATAPGAYPRARRSTAGPNAPRARRNRPPGARSAAVRSKMHPQFRKDAERVLHRRTRSVRWSGWRWSSPNFRRTRGKKQDDAAGCRAASRPARRCPERLPAVPPSRARARSAAHESKSASAPARSSTKCAPLADPRHHGKRFFLAIFRSRKAATAAGSGHRRPGGIRRVL